MFCLNPVRYSENVFSIYDALHDVIPFVQFEKFEKRPWSNFTSTKVAHFNFAKSIVFHVFNFCR